ncbi:hypothetical protein [Candidatus Palauibacter sp.]|uniref:hypothetical protein n=1 Tax=Candidatus Palauibacter sp. TaxID=3101350 RepID=UPI003B0181A8
MTAPEETPEPSVPGSSNPASKAAWWRHPITGIATVLLMWFGLTWTMLRSTKDDIAAVETELKEDIAAVEAELKEDITAAEVRLNTSITGVETRLSNHLGRVEGRLDRIMEILLDDARSASAIEDQQEEDGSR